MDSTLLSFTCGVGLKDKYSYTSTSWAIRHQVPTYLDVLLPHLAHVSMSI